jgi:hypothetical protein
MALVKKLFPRGFEPRRESEMTICDRFSRD